jgi:DNA-binding NtrC family response regulator
MLQKAESEKDDLYNIRERQPHLHVPFEPRALEDRDIARSKRIILVDDDDAIRKILFLLLSELKFEVQSFDNAHDALAFFNNKGAELVLTDIQMPDMDGCELAFNIKKTSPKTPVILMTGMEKDEVEDDVNNGYADFILFKPFNIKYLRKIVYSFLANKR